MIVWIDAQLSPALAPWLVEQFGVEALSVRYLQMVHAKTRTFPAARVLIDGGEALVEITDLQ